MVAYEMFFPLHNHQGSLEYYFYFFFIVFSALCVIIKCFHFMVSQGGQIISVLQKEKCSLIDSFTILIPNAISY